jgi:hypothetical protein
MVHLIYGYKSILKDGAMIGAPARVNYDRVHTVSGVLLQANNNRVKE